jgi:hypothetical protein
MSGAYIQLRPVRGLEDIEYNFQVVLQTMTNLSGDYIQPASIPITAFRDPLVNQNGDAVLDGLSCATLEVSGLAALASGTFSSTLTVSGASTFATVTINGETAATQDWTNSTLTAALVPYLTSADATATYRTLADSYSQAAVDAAIAAATPSTATTTEEGLVLQAAAVADLGQTISDPPTQSEVQAISDKIDALLAALRAADLIDT